VFILVIVFTLRCVTAYAVNSERLSTEPHPDAVPWVTVHAAFAGDRDGRHIGGRW